MNRFHKENFWFNGSLICVYEDPATAFISCKYCALNLFCLNFRDLKKARFGICNHRHIIFLEPDKYL